MSWFAAFEAFKVVRTTKKLLFMSSVLIFLLPTGCVPLIIPTSPKTVAGTEIHEEETTSIQPGMTTREEIVERLGEPDWQFDDIGIIAYRWTKQEWNNVMIWLAPYPSSGGISEFETGRSYILFFLFDIDQKLTAHEIVKQSTWPGSTVRKEARNWAGKQGVLLPHCAKGFISPNIPKNRSVICVYRKSGFSDCPDWGTIPLIRLDGKNAVELPKKQYFLLYVSPGSHEISVNPVPNHFALVSPESRPIRTITVNTLPSKPLYLEIKITHGRGMMEPILTVRPEADVVDKLRDFRHVP